MLTASRSLKANPSSIVSTTVDEMTGEEKKRLVNRFRWKGYGPATIMFSDANVSDFPSVGLEQALSSAQQASGGAQQTCNDAKPIIGPRQTTRCGGRGSQHC